MIADPVIRAGLGIIGLAAFVSFLASCVVIWSLTYGLLFVIGVVIASRLGTWAVNIVAIGAMWHLFKSLRRLVKVL
jgi:hypothetical protein